MWNWDASIFGHDLSLFKIKVDINVCFSLAVIIWEIWYIALKYLVS